MTGKAHRRMGWRRRPPAPERAVTMNKTERLANAHTYAIRTCRWAELTDYRGCDHAAEREVTADWESPGDEPRMALAIYCEVRGAAVHVTRVDWVTEDGELLASDIEGHDEYVWAALDYVQPLARWSIREQIIIDHRRAQQLDGEYDGSDHSWHGGRFVRVDWDRDGFFYAEVN